MTREELKECLFMTTATIGIMLMGVGGAFLMIAALVAGILAKSLPALVAIALAWAIAEHNDWVDLVGWM